MSMVKSLRKLANNASKVSELHRRNGHFDEPEMALRWFKLRPKPNTHKIYKIINITPENQKKKK